MPPPIDNSQYFLFNFASMTKFGIPHAHMFKLTIHETSLSIFL